VSYESAFHLVDVRIKRASLPEFQRAVSHRKRGTDDALRCFLERVVVDCEGFVQFTASETDLIPTLQATGRTVYLLCLASGAT